LERSKTTNSEDVATYMAVDETATPNGFAPTGTVVDASAGPGAAVNVEHVGGWTTTLSPEEANIVPAVYLSPRTAPPGSGATVAKAPVDSASGTAVTTAKVVDVTLTRARLAKGRVDIMCNLLVRSVDVQDAGQLR
jgi:hypothetical protein